MTTQILEAPDWPARLRRAGLWLMAFTLVAVALGFSTATQDQFELPKQMLLRAFSSLMLALLLAALLCESPARWRRTPLDLPVLAWSLWLVATTVHSVSPGVSWRGEYENFSGSLTQLNYSALFFVTTQLAGRKDAARFLARAMLAAATGAALYAVAQTLQRDLIQWSQKSIISDRFFGPLGNPNFLAGLMAMAIPLKLALAWAERRGTAPRDREQAWRWAMLGLWIVAYAFKGQSALLNPFLSRPGASAVSAALLLAWLAALALEPLLRLRGRARAGHLLAQGADLLLYLDVLANTGTRGGYLGLMFGLSALAVGWLWSQRQDGQPLGRLMTRAALGLAALVLASSAVIAALGPGFRTRMVASLSNPTQAYENSRREIWVPALRIWKDHPWMGTGVDTFKTVFPAYASSRFNKHDGENVSSRMAHCEPLQILATQGLMGLLLWAWLCMAMLAAAAKAVASAAEEDRALWVGLGALSLAYLSQNLVSFGVAAITVPFWAAAGLLAAASPASRETTLPGPSLRPSVAMGLAAMLAVVCLGLDNQTLQADMGYAFGNQAQAALPTLDQAGFADAQGAAYWALNDLQGGAANGDLNDETDLWRGATAAWEQQAGQDASKEALLLPGYRRAAASLMMIVAANRLERSVALCPGEVKYRIYLGLCYEELARRTPSDRRKIWTLRAREAYQAGVAMNPRNGYYHGNLGRLYSLACEQGDDTAYAPAMAAYLRAIDCAPATRLFYENLLLLQAHYADLDGADQALRKAVAADPDLASQLLLAAASTFFQWRSSKSPAWTPQKKAEALPMVVGWASKARTLDPDNADTTLALAVFEQEAGQKREAQRWLREAVRLRPGFDEALRWAKEQQIKL